MANDVKLKLSVDGARVVSQQIDGVTKNLGDMDRSANLAAVGMKKLTGMLGGFSAALTIGKLVQVQREFDVLNSSLITVTGSSARAAQEFAWIKQFAATTPYQLNEVTGAFVKMKALGLDASAKALASYGNTASAMGKGLNQMIEAVADAATGEFERLKEFGIKAKKSGDDVSLTFQGVTTNIGNNSAEITRYLQAIGENEFAGAMATRAATLDGAISNLADTWDELFRTVNTNNAGTLIYDSVTLASGAINDAITVLNAMNGVAAESAKQTGAMATVQEALAITFETVAALAADFKYVLVQVGTEIGGLAAQAVQILQFNFAGAASIRQAMVSDAKTARAELDATQARILGARAAAQELASYNTRNASAASDPRRLDAETKVATAIATTTKLTKEQTAAVKAAAKAQAEAADYNTKAVDALYDAQEKTRLQVEDSIKTARTTLEQIEFETRLLEMNTEQRALATLERELELKGIVKGTLAYDAYIVKLREAMAIKTGKEAGIKAADEMADAQKKAAEESSKYWEDALLRAFESGKGFFASLWDTIKNTLKTQVLKVLVSATGLTGMSAAGAGDLVSGASGGNLLGVASNLSTIYKTITGGFTALGDSVAFAAQDVGAWLVNNTSGVLNQAGASLMQSAGTFGTVAGYAAGAAAGLAIGNAISGKYGSSGVVTAGTAIGSIFGGPIGGAIGGAIGGLVNRAFGRGPTELTASGTRGTFSDTSFSGVNYANYKKDGGWFRSDKNWSDISAIDPATVDAWSTAFAGVKGSVAGMAASLGLATDKINAYSKYVDIAAGTTAEALTALFTSMADDMALAAAPGLTAFKKTGEVASTTLSRLSGSLATANAWLSMLRNRLFDVSLSGADAASSLADAFGSLDNLAASSAAYYELFYSEAERTARTTEDLAKAMALVNVALPDTNAAFRAVVTGLDLNTEAGRNAYAVMLALAPEFAATAAAADKMAVDTAAAILKTFTGNGQLVPVLNVASLALGDVASGAGSMSTALAYINVIMGNSSSGVITLGGTISTLGTGMTASQQSAALLTAQIVALQDSSDGARIDFVALQTALNGVNTATFVATITGVFDNLAVRISNVIDSITAERIAVREAALQIINPTVMSKYDIQRGISSIGTALPSNSAVVTANATLAAADANLAKVSALTTSQTSAAQALTTSTAKLATDQAYYVKKAAESQAILVKYGAATAVAAYTFSTATNRTTWNSAGYAPRDGIVQAQTIAEERGNAGDWQAWFNYLQYGAARPATNADSPWTALDGANAIMAATERAMAEQKATLAQITTALGGATLAGATTTQTTAAAAAQKAALDYAAALQTFAIDASKSVTKLSRLREETVKYYEAQKQLADLMTTSAAGLRQTVADYRYGQLSPDAQLASLQTQFSSAYSLALSTKNDGATLAGYGDRVNALLGPLIDKLGENNQTNLVASYLAQAESVAALIEQTIPVNYQQDSLLLLGSIDATLAALDASSQSAEAIIANAVTAGSNRTAAGLSAVIAALTGNTIPAFAAGGAFSGGVRLVGENGPELEVTGPSRIFNASQTRDMLGGGGATQDLVNEVRALRAEVQGLRFEARATATNTNKTAKILGRVTQDGDSLTVSTDTANPLATVAA